MLGFKGDAPRPVPGRGRNLLDDRRALAIHLHATAWGTIGLEKIVGQGPHLHTPPAHRRGFDPDRSCAQQALDSSQQTEWFQTAVWCLLQLHPIDRVVRGSLASQLGKAVAVINTHTHNKPWQNVNSSLSGPHPPEPPAAISGPLHPRL